MLKIVLKKRASPGSKGHQASVTSHPWQGAGSRVVEREVPPRVDGHLASAGKSLHISDPQFPRLESEEMVPIFSFSSSAGVNSVKRAC